MRHITGYFEGTQYVVVDYGHGIVECPVLLLSKLTESDGALPTGDGLLAKCRAILTEPITIEESKP